jgi:hypothetical protein
VLESETSLYRPRQIYDGKTERDYVPMAERPTIECVQENLHPPVQGIEIS